MEQVILIIHLMLALGIICLVLLQRSEGGGLGIGQSGGMGGFATPGGTASAMTRVTAIMAFCFFGTSLFLGVLAGKHSSSVSILDELDKPVAAIEQSIDGAEDVPAAPVEEPEVPLE